MYGHKLSQRSNSGTFSYEIPRSLRIKKKTLKERQELNKRVKNHHLVKPTHARARRTRDLIRNITFLSSQRDTHSEFVYAIVKLPRTFVGTFFWVNTTKTRIMDALPFRGRIVLLGWEDYRNLIKSMKKPTATVRRKHWGTSDLLSVWPRSKTNCSDAKKVRKAMTLRQIFKRGQENN